MTSFKQFILEEAFDIDRFFEECAPILKQYKDGGGFLYQGSYAKGEWVVEKFEERREPRDSTQLVHDAMNYNFRKEFGVEPRNWKFAALKHEQTFPYGFRGNARVIFPIGNTFEFVYSPKIYDAANNYDRLKAEYKIKYPELSFDDRVNMILKFIKSDFTKEYSYRHTKNIATAIESNYDCEVMFKCDNYYSVSENTGNIFNKIKERL